MKKYKKLLSVAIIAVFALAYPAFGQMDHNDHGDHSGHAHEMEASKHGDMSHEDHAGMDHSGHGHGDHSGHEGELIHEVNVNGYQMAYHLIDMKERMKGMENMPEMKATHHLMVYVKNPEGKTVDKAKAGYLIENPDGSEQKAMTMAMSGGYGADIVLDKPGTYVIKTKVMAGDERVMDSFEYEMK